ncbi:MAG: ATP-binding protein [Clostridia bacterium]|nr:ATP-binding protein [Clostridia bacterium]
MVLENVIKLVIDQQRSQLNQKDLGLSRALVPATRSLSSHALIISGIRRCGKSTLLLQMMQSMNADEYLFLNFDTPQLYGFSTTDFTRLDKIIAIEKPDILFFDEIQVVVGWEMYVRQKLDEGFKVIATGSNASMLSRELGSRLTGRHITQELYPFSYGEFLRFRQLSASTESLQNYMKLGGFPEFLKVEDNEQLIMLYDDILVRDIVARYGINDALGLKRLANYLLANIANRITATKLKQPLSVGATSTVLNWLSHLEFSYLFGFMPMFSYSTKAQLINPRKVYAIDTGLVHVLSLSKTDDRGRKLENLVYLHLRQQYSELYYFDDKGECDFVAFKNGAAEALIQVCYDLTPENLDREVKGLTAAMKFFNLNKGTIVTFADSDTIEAEGYQIEVAPAFDFLCRA